MTMRCHYTLGRMTNFFFFSVNTKCEREWEQLELPYVAGGNGKATHEKRSGSFFSS